MVRDTGPPATECVIHWFRRDLRLEDNSALTAALRSGDPVLPVFILDDAILAHDIAASRLGFLRIALEDLDQRLRGHGGRLLVRRGDAPRELNRIAEEANAWGVYLNRDHTPYGRQRDARATRGLQMTGVVTQTFDDLLLVSPQTMAGSDGLPPAAFADFSSSWLEHLEVDPEPPAPASGTFLAASAPTSIEGWADSLAPPPGGDGVQLGATPDSARRCLQDLLADLAIEREPTESAGPGARLWPALGLGTISAREVARAVLARGAANASSRVGAEAFILALCRREHAFHLLHARPELLREPGLEGEFVRHLLFRNRLT